MAWASSLSVGLPLAFGVLPDRRRLMTTPCFTATCGVASALLWVARQPDISTIDEAPGERGWRPTAVRAALGKITLARRCALFGALSLPVPWLLCSALSAPYYGVAGAVWCVMNTGLGILARRIFVGFANGLASRPERAVSWAAHGDNRNRCLIRALSGQPAGARWLVVGHDIVGVGVTRWPGTLWLSRWPSLCWALPMPAAQLGRRATFLDMAGGNKRTDLCRRGNSIMCRLGLFTLLRLVLACLQFA